jgi:hypothetical protein
MMAFRFMVLTTVCNMYSIMKPHSTSNFSESTMYCIAVIEAGKWKKESTPEVYKGEYDSPGEDVVVAELRVGGEKPYLWSPSVRQGSTSTTASEGLH